MIAQGFLLTSWKLANMESQMKPGCLRPIIELMACLLEKGSVESTHLLACLFACLHIVPSGAAFEGAPIHNVKRGAGGTPRTREPC